MIMIRMTVEKPLSSPQPHRSICIAHFPSFWVPVEFTHVQTFPFKFLTSNPARPLLDSPSIKFLTSYLSPHPQVVSTQNLTTIWTTRFPHDAI